ncbi:hypothetical protein [Rhodoligotrophos defluvii]|uniref:hypothetical protein n=1 Tax=Rhodoligotrophos defluvii TaxID=2561934 RepID=UPI0010C9FE05|nr:hypothetical protein [Rhodoligotrophos defluvii]
MLAQKPQLPAEPPAFGPTYASRVVIALESDWPVDVAARRLLEAPVIGPTRSDNLRYDNGARILFGLDREQWRLTPDVRSVDGLPIVDSFTRFDIVGRGYAPATGHEGQVSQLSPDQIAELVAPLLPKGGVGSVNFIGSHVEPPPPALEGRLGSGFLYDFAESLRRTAGNDRLPEHFAAEVGNVAVDAAGDIRAVTAVSADKGWRTWDADFGRQVLHAQYQTDGWLHYKLDIGLPVPHDAHAIRDGLPDADAGPLERHTILSLGELPEPRSASLNNLLDLSDGDAVGVTPGGHAFPFIGDTDGILGPVPGEYYTLFYD